MAIFDSESVRYLTYYIVLTDAAAVAAYQAQYPTGVNRALTPNAADVEFSAPFRGFADPKDAGNYLWTPWYGDNDPRPFPLDVARFTRRSGGFWGIGGTTITYYWIGQFVLGVPVQPTSGGDVPGVYAPIPKRRWVEGFESPSLYGTAPTTGLAVSPDASRHVGGLGLAVRGATTVVNLTTNFYDGTQANAHSRESFAFRLRQMPTTGATPFWRCHGFPSTLAGIEMSLTTAGQIAVTSLDSLGTRTLMGTYATLTAWDGTRDGQAGWHEFDLLIDYNSLASGGAGRFRLYQRGALIADLAIAQAMGGLGQNSSRHVSSEFGWTGGSANDLYFDVDDWRNTDIPNISGVESLTSKDWLQSAKIARLRATDFTANLGTWTGDVRTCLQQVFGGSNVTGAATLASSTSGAVLECDTDSAVVIGAETGIFVDDVTGAKAVASFAVGLVSSRGSTSGQLGYSIAGGSPVMAAIAQQTSKNVNAVLYTPDGTVANFADLLPIVIRHTKGADGSASAVYQFDAQVEMVGTFFLEDVRVAEVGDTVPDMPGHLGCHNRPYPRSPWATEPLSAPIGPYIVKSFTYTGNGTGQDLDFRAPVAFFFTRPLTSSSGGAIWGSSWINGRQGFAPGQCPAVCDADQDLSYVPAAGENAQATQYRVRLAGGNTQVNANGVTYHAIAVMDPGARFLLAGSMSHRATLTSALNRLIDPAFLAEFALFMPGVFNNTGGVSFYSKSSNDAAASILGYDLAAVTDAVTFGAGTLATQANFHTLGPEIPFLLFRSADGNKDTGQTGVFSVGGYVGDGASSKSLSVGRAGKRPVIAFFFSAAGGFMRDPSHSSNNSEAQGGGNSTTAITGGGIDTVNVGSSLNGNGTNYNYLIFWGDTTAGNNGWGVDGEYEPVEADAPATGPWPPAPDPTDYDTPTPEPTPTPIPDDITTDVATACLAATQQLVNVSLSRIGVSRQITALDTELSEEAVTARLHFGLDVAIVLRDFPWAFATRYANLVLVGGTADVPVNDDWTYSYRAPASMLFARRLVSQDGHKRGYDPNPPKFRVGSDATGGLIYADLPATTDVPLQVEYTIRPDCPASVGDALFRDALAWKHAHSQAGPIAKDPKVVTYCWSMYQDALARAMPVNANEAQQEPPGEADWISAR